MSQMTAQYFDVSSTPSRSKYMNVVEDEGNRWHTRKVDASDGKNNDETMKTPSLRSPESEFSTTFATRNNTTARWIE